MCRLRSYYYVPQVLNEMRAMRMNAALFVSWGQTGTHCWWMPFDEDMWVKTYELMTDFVLGDMPFELYEKRAKAYAMDARRFAAKAERLHPKGGFPSVQGAQLP